jgi:TIR domain/Kelch motif
MDRINENKRVEIFCCYAREDQPLLIELKKHLRLWEHQGLIAIWTDTDITAGTNWQKEIRSHLNSAHIILLLVSPDFLASDYCSSTEMAHAIERYQSGKVEVIPIILRHCAWEDAPFSEIQVLPTNAEPVIGPKWHNPDEAFTDIAKGIRQVAAHQVEATKQRQSEDKQPRQAQNTQDHKAQEISNKQPEQSTTPPPPHKVSPTPAPSLTTPNLQHLRIPRRKFLLALALGAATVGGIGGVYSFIWLSRSPVNKKPNSTPTSGWRTAAAPPRSTDSFGVTALNGGSVLIEGGRWSVNESEIYDPIQNLWKPTGNLNHARQEHSTTLLTNGKVLVAGGYGINNSGNYEFRSTAELYDPDPNVRQWAFTKGGNMSLGRTKPTAIQLLGGNVLVVGGWNGKDPLDIAEVYDYGRESWSRVRPMNTGRIFPSVILLPDGKVLVAGGWDKNGTSNTAELYEPDTQNWISLPPMHTGRAGSAMTWLPSVKKVLAVGGTDNSGNLIKTAELYGPYDPGTDPTTIQWSLTTPMQHERSLCTSNAILLKDETVLVAGGDVLGTSEIYHPISETWDAPTSIGRLHCGGPTVSLTDGRVMLVGKDYSFIYTPT